MARYRRTASRRSSRSNSTRSSYSRRPVRRRTTSAAPRRRAAVGRRSSSARTIRIEIVQPGANSLAAPVLPLGKRLANTPKRSMF